MMERRVREQRRDFFKGAWEEQGMTEKDASGAIWNHTCYTLSFPLPSPWENDACPSQALQTEVSLSQDPDAGRGPGACSGQWNANGQPVWSRLSRNFKSDCKLWLSLQSPFPSGTRRASPRWDLSFTLGPGVKKISEAEAKTPPTFYIWMWMAGVLSHNYTRWKGNKS